MDFACEMMDLCRGTQEVEAVLSEGGEENGHTSRDPLARLKMAIEYEEKKVSYIIVYFIKLFTLKRRSWRCLLQTVGHIFV